jgi:3'(2'), 5'-bisphosphate nucleotidase
MKYEHELKAAMDAARRASARIMELYAAFVAIPDAPADISTQADRDAQEIILQTLRITYPDDAYQAEEATPTLDACRRTGPRVWVIDPIDGTRGFAQKVGQFSVMIALVSDGVPVVGVVWEPALNRRTYATAGSGCFCLDGAAEAAGACRVTATAALEKATLVQSHSKPERPSAQVVALSPGKVVETHSAGVKLARVARGEADLYVNHYPSFNDWDIAAGHVLVTEAGGKVSGMKGQAIAYGNGVGGQRSGLIASNGVLHDAAVARLRDLF